MKSVRPVGIVTTSVCGTLTEDSATRVGINTKMSALSYDLQIHGYMNSFSNVQSGILRQTTTNIASNSLIQTGS